MFNTTLNGGESDGSKRNRIMRAYMKKNVKAVPLATKGCPVFAPPCVLERHLKSVLLWVVVPLIVPPLSGVLKYHFKTISYKIFTTVLTTVGAKLYAPVPYPLVLENRHLTKLFSTFRNKI